MKAYIQELYRFRELLWMWTIREIQVRYKQSILGAAWAVVQPIALMLAFTVVATFLRGQIQTDGVAYPVFYYTALLPWTFFTNSITQSSTSMITNINLLIKTYFPREILPIAKVGIGFFDYLIAALVFVVMLFIYRVEITWMVLWVPVLLAVQIVLTLGLAFLTSSVIVLYRDVRFIVPLFLQILLFLTPIIYPAGLVPPAIRPYYLALNPVAALIDSYRQTILYGHPPDWSLLTAGLWAILTFTIGYFLFKRLERIFADII